MTPEMTPEQRRREFWHHLRWIVGVLSLLCGIIGVVFVQFVWYWVSIGFGVFFLGVNLLIQKGRGNFAYALFLAVLLLVLRINHLYYHDQLATNILFGSLIGSLLGVAPVMAIKGWSNSFKALDGDDDGGGRVYFTSAGELESRKRRDF